MPNQVILFRDANFHGPHKHVFDNEINLNASDDGSFNDSVSSIAVLSGNWTFFKDSGFQNPYPVVLGPGLYSFVGRFKINNDDLSSLMTVADPATITGDPLNAHAILFEHGTFHGDHRHVFTPEPNLPDNAFNDVTSSIVVEQGNWAFFRNSGFDAAYPPVLGPGVYPSVDEIGITNDDLSSLQPTDAAATVRNAVDNEVLLFIHGSFHGAHKHVFSPEPNLNASDDQSFNDAISSLVVLRGTWSFFADSDFRSGYPPSLGPGAYPSVTDQNIRNDDMSSLRPTVISPAIPASLILFRDANFHGPHKHVFDNEINLNASDDGSFNDSVSSIAVLSGNWTFFKDSGFQNPYPVVLGPGLYSFVGRFKINNDDLSSLMTVADPATITGDPLNAHAILFEHGTFHGDHRHVFTPEPNLPDNAFNDVTSSIVVEQGNWAFFRNSGFDAAYPPVLGPGVYPSVDEIGITNDDLSSLQPTDAAATVRNAVDNEVLLFIHGSFHGAHKHVFSPEPNLNASDDQSFNDAISSLVVLRGTWSFFADSDFRSGYPPSLGPGAYPSVTDQNIRNDDMSSLRPIPVMTNIQDVSPTVSGRMLALACSQDGRVVFAGCYSNMWRSKDGGQKWDQIVWPQPPANQFEVPGSLGGWCVVDIAVSPDSATVLALTVNDRVVGSRGIWRSTDGGFNWAQVHQSALDEAVGQLQWALGSDHLVYATVGSALAISKNAGASFDLVFPWGTDSAHRVNHVAVWQNSPADTSPAVIYALSDSAMSISFDGGATWMEDQGILPSNVGGAMSPIANSNTPTVMVISPRVPLEVYVAGNGSDQATPARLWRGDYTQFPFGTKQSHWDPVVLPDELTSLSTQDAGNVFLATTQKGRGDLLFYGAQRSVVYVGPLDPASAFDWQPLDRNVHADLHGILLSPDFRAEINNGDYQSGTGTIWLLNDGGLYRSTDGGKHFKAAQDLTTLSCVNVAGVAIPANGPALSLNTGDNDGFYSMDGGQHWSPQDYGGGDNDCSYADPLRSYSMLVFTPRWNIQGSTADGTRNSQTVAIYEASPTNLPNGAAGTTRRHIVPGPPLLPPPPVPFKDLWNAGSFYGSRGSRPIVLGLPGEDAPAQGDYSFVLNPTTQPVLVRTQNILDIASRDEWVTTATAPGQGANVYLQGPPLPLLNLGVVQASGGHAATVFHVSGDGTLWTWTAGAANWSQLVPGGGANSATRFFVSPYQPSLIYILDGDHVKRSDDGGHTWQVDQSLERQLTWDHQIALSSNENSSGLGDHFDLILTDMQFDPNDPLTRFAVGEGGAFCTKDGVNWTRLLHTGALPGRPANCYYDWISDPSSRALYVAFAGRSLVRIRIE